MNSSQRRILVAFVVLLVRSLGAQDSREYFDLVMRERAGGTYPPMLWQRVGEEVVWLALDDEAAGPAADPISQPAVPRELGARERWLMSTIRRFEGVRSAQTVERTTVRLDGISRSTTSERGIEVRGSEQVLPRIREFFDHFMAGSKKVVTIELNVLEADQQPAPNAPEVAAVVVPLEQWESRGRQDKTSISSPTMVVFANQSAKLSFAEQVSYLKDYDVELVQGQLIADPIVGTVDEGFEMELTPIFDPDRNQLIVIGSLGFSHVVRPIPEHRIKVAGSEVTVQVPSVVSRRWQGEVKLDAGESVIKITGLQYNRAGSERPLDVDVWCRVTLGEGSPRLSTGEIVDRDEKSGNLFVAFPVDYVPDDPWSKAPKEVSVYRKNEKIGTARLAGGWVMPGQTHPVIAIYQLAEGTPKDGDSVK